MLIWIIKNSLRFRYLVVAFAAGMMVFGISALSKMPIDVFPDLDRPGVTVMTHVPGLSPEETEARLTEPIEAVIKDLPGVEALWSSSSIGLSHVHAVFGWNEEGEAARLFEAYRVLRTNLILNREAPRAHPITLITSSRAGEGKTTTTCGLGVVMAQAGLRVLLVDGDLRRANLSRLFSAKDGLGFSDAIDDKPIRVRCDIERADGVDA